MIERFLPSVVLVSLRRMRPPYCFDLCSESGRIGCPSDGSIGYRGENFFVGFFESGRGEWVRQIQR